MNLIENYCYMVVRFLKNKEEIKKEVEEMIYSSLEEKFGYKEKYSEEEIVEVLKKLGNPNIMALKYANLPNHIISEKYIYHFYYVYIILLIIVFVANLFGFVFDSVGDPKELFTNIFEFLGGLFAGPIFTFGGLCLVFMGIEYSKQDLKLDNFNPLSLKGEKREYSKNQNYGISDSIVSIIFSLILVVIFNLFPDVIAIYTLNDKIPLFNLDYLTSIIWGINLLFLITIGGSIYKLVSRRKNIFKVVGFYLIGIFSTVVTTILIANNDFINPNFINYTRGFSLINDIYLKFGDMVTYRIIMIVIGLVVLGYTIEFIVNLSQVLLFNRKNK